MNEKEAWGQAFENGRQQGDKDGYERGLREAVRHGRWLIDPDGYYPYCSGCREEPKGGVMTNYCPNCGARMDGGVDHD